MTECHEVESHTACDRQMTADISDGTKSRLAGRARPMEISNLQELGA